jgi:hypothetical protein
VLTGVLYVNTSKPTFVELLNMSDDTLATLHQSRTRPDKSVLDQVMEELALTGYLAKIQSRPFQILVVAFSSVYDQRSVISETDVSFYVCPARIGRGIF